MIRSVDEDCGKPSLGGPEEVDRSYLGVIDIS